jgi:hypothetical protein
LWPNLLALDAPFVAVVWQRFLGHHFAVPVPWPATAALAAAVWAIYLVDRWLDGRRSEFDAERHRFAAAYPRTFALFATMAVIAALRHAELDAERTAKIPKSAENSENFTRIADTVSTFRPWPGRCLGARGEGRLR